MACKSKCSYTLETLSTLHDHVKGKYTEIGAGGPTALKSKDEQEIVITCQVLAEMGFRTTKQLVETVVTRLR